MAAEMFEGTITDLIAPKKRRWARQPGRARRARSEEEDDGAEPGHGAAGAQIGVWQAQIPAVRSLARAGSSGLAMTA